ncbi:MAG: sigma-70 family RNA polymerase sigma factor [Ignavibacteriae bacterium]|nr:sigma-70 family RNA polymerase sigma factor [Ignavibacteria bacterium]MBI3365516.1 sigma-70 family RNA polymerase sigma factor [Ignavibacteriota bacterium]
MDVDVRLGFEEVFLHHLDALYRTSLRLTRSKADAEDLLQETLLRAFKGYHQLLDHTKARAWLFQILINTFYNWKKKQKREPPIIDVELSEDLVASSLDVPVYNPVEVFDSMLTDEIEAALGQLHSEFRLVVLLYDVEGLSYDEIAEVCRCSKGTVASRLYRAREILRGALEEYAQRHGYL